MGQTIVLCRLRSCKSGRVEKPAEVEEHKGAPKSEHSAKRAPSAGRFFMKFRGPQALPNRPRRGCLWNMRRRREFAILDFARRETALSCRVGNGSGTKNAARTPKDGALAYTESGLEVQNGNSG